MKIIRGLKAVTARRKAVRPEDVIQAELNKAYAIHPGYLMAGSVTSALTEAGFRILSDDDLQDEIGHAFQAGVDSVTEA